MVTLRRARSLSAALRGIRSVWRLGKHWRYGRGRVSASALRKHPAFADPARIRRSASVTMCGCTSGSDGCRRVAEDTVREDPTILNPAQMRLSTSFTVGGSSRRDSIRGVGAPPPRTCSCGFVRRCIAIVRLNPWYRLVRRAGTRSIWGVARAPARPLASWARIFVVERRSSMQFGNCLGPCVVYVAIT